MPNIKDPSSPFGTPPESWTQENPADPAQVHTDPTQVKKTPDDEAQDLAKQWVGQMTRIGPEFYIDDKTASLLTALKALGLPMGSDNEILFLASLFTDNTVLYDDVSWFNAQEWELLLNWLSKLPTKISYVVSMRLLAQVSSPELELLKSLHDLNFEILDGSQKTQSLLKLIAGSHSQSSLIAQNILSLDPISMTKLFKQFNNEAYGDFSQVPSAPAPQQVQMTMPEVNQPAIAPSMGIDNPGGIEEPEVFEVVPTPAKNFGSGAIAKSKMVADFANRYEDIVKGLPQDVKPAPYGEAIPGQKIWPQAGGNAPNIQVTGGMFLKDYEDNGSGMNAIPGADAIAVGIAADGRLAVRTFPEGLFELWDLPTRLVRLSNLKAPKRDF